jgi:hypothetical protein
MSLDARAGARLDLVRSFRVPCPAPEQVSARVGTLAAEVDAGGPA